MDQKTSQTTTTVTTTACGSCGTAREGPPLTWTCSVENGRRLYFCETCSRRHLRSIEERLDSAGW